MPAKKSNLIAVLSEATSGEAGTVQPKTFTVIVTGEWFKQIQAGTKTLEYRVIKPYWTNRLIDAKTGKNKPFDSLKIAWGYTSDPDKIITLPWRGFEVLRDFVHPYFGNTPVDVYAIKLTDEVK